MHTASGKWKLAITVWIITLCIYRLLEERVSRLKTMLAAIQHGQILSVGDQKLLDSVNEDLHWLLLVTGLTAFCCGLSPCQDDKHMSNM